MNRYETYKPSSINWLPEIPINWEMSKSKYCFKYTTGFTPPSGQDEFYNGDHTWVTIADMNKKVILDSANTLSQIAIERFKPDITKKDSLLFSFKLSVGKVAYAGKDLYTNEAIISILPNMNYDLRYFYYTLPEQLLQNANENIYGAKILNQELIRNASICFPPIEVQIAIANFLDEKTTQIDKLISNKQKLIELLKEERTAIINEAVSGNGKNWVVKKLSHDFNKIGSGTTPASGNEEYYNGTINWLQTGDLNDGEINSTSKKITNKALEDYTTLRLFPKGSLVIAMYGATIGKVGIINIPTTTNQACCVLSEPFSFDINYVFWWFVGNKEFVVSKSYGGGQPNISQELIRTLRLPCPSIEEQTFIVQNINSETLRIANAISKIEKEIGLMNEYRTALISEVVTGKIKVI